MIKKVLFIGLFFASIYGYGQEFVVNCKKKQMIASGYSFYQNPFSDYNTLKIYFKRNEVEFIRPIGTSIYKIDHLTTHEGHTYIFVHEEGNKGFDADGFYFILEKDMKEIKADGSNVLIYSDCIFSKS